MYYTPVLFVVQLSDYLDNPCQNIYTPKAIVKENWTANSCFSSYQAIIDYPQRSKRLVKLPCFKLANMVCSLPYLLHAKDWFYDQIYYDALTVPKILLHSSALGTSIIRKHGILSNTTSKSYRLTV